MQKHFNEISSSLEFGAYLKPENYFVSYIFRTTEEMNRAEKRTWMSLDGKIDNYEFVMEKQEMKNIKIIEVNERDAQFLQELMNNDSVMTVLNEVPTTVNVWTDSIREWEQDADEEDYIIFDESIPIGWLGINGLSTEEKKVYIKMIALLPQYQNGGIGQYVISKIIENLKLRGYVSIGLYTDQRNVQAQQCYLKSGFDVTSKIEQKMSNGTVIKRYKMERFI